MNKDECCVRGTARFLFGVLMLSIALSTIDSSIAVDWVLVLLTVIGGFLTVWGFVKIRQSL